MMQFVLGLVTLWITVSARRVIDLTYELNPDVIVWINTEPFELTVHNNGTQPGGFWLSSNTVKFTEHTGTHTDAPSHFSMHPDVYYASTIPPERLICPLHLFDLEAQAEEDRDYLVTPEDISNFEKEFGLIKEGSVVIFNFGWYKKVQNTTDYFGTVTNNDTQLHFPGVGMEAAKILVSRRIYGIGLDTPSIDKGSAINYPVHQFIMGKNIYALENVADTSALPRGGVGTTLFVGLPKIGGGSGGTTRLLAVVDEELDNFAVSSSISHWFILLSFSLTSKM